MPHATPERIASYSNPPEQRSAVERIVEKVPGGRAEPDQKDFEIYHLVLNSQYCRDIGNAPAQ